MEAIRPPPRGGLGSAEQGPQIPASPEKLAIFLEDRYVTASSLRIRARSNTSAAVVTALPRGTRVAVYAGSGKWLEVSLPDGRRGWAYGDYLSRDPPVVERAQPVVSTRGLPDRTMIADKLIERSIADYPGNCPCPYNSDRAGRSCGARSAWSRRGGAAPLCYRDDVTDGMINAFR